MMQHPWFSLISPTIELPGSGDLDFRFAPYTKWEAPALFRGDEQVEMRAFTEIGSPGRQLGKILDALVKLTQDNYLTGAEADEILAMHQGIEKIKTEVGASTEKQARAVLEKLEKQDKEALDRIIAEYHNRPKGD